MRVAGRSRYEQQPVISFSNMSYVLLRTSCTTDSFGRSGTTDGEPDLNEQIYEITIEMLRGVCIIGPGCAIKEKTDSIVV